MRFRYLRHLSKDGMVRICVEMLILSAAIIVSYDVVVDPWLTSIAPERYGASERDFGRYDNPDTVADVANAVYGALVLGGFLYWRIHHTELGELLKEQFAEEYDVNR